MGLAGVRSRVTPRRAAVVRVVAALLAAGCGGAAAQSLDGPDAPDELAAMLDRVVAGAFDADARDDRDRCVGAVVAAVVPGRAVARGYGATEAGGASRPDADTLFQIGSVTKVLTGLALARREVDGGLALDVRATDLLDADLAATLASSAITLGELVTHRAGFPRFPDNLVDRDGDGRPDPTHDPLSPGTGYARDHLRAYLQRFAPESPPGAVYAYSNVGLGLLGVALADDGGHAGYHDLLRATMTADLGMSDTWGLVAALDAGALARVARGYATDGPGRRVGTLGQMGVLAGSGEVVISGADALRLLGALTGEVPSGLDAAIARALEPLAPAEDGVELGRAIEVRRDATGARYTKAGVTTSYTAYLSFRRAPRLGILVMTSCGVFPRVRELADALDRELVAAAARW